MILCPEGDVELFLQLQNSIYVHKWEMLLIILSVFFRPKFYSFAHCWMVILLVWHCHSVPRNEVRDPGYQSKSNTWACVGFS